jgi:D-Tyr-tRNAtyr deacylase
MNPIVKKVLDAKWFEDAQGGLWKQTIKECEGEILCGE